MNDVIKMVRYWRYNKTKKNWRKLHQYSVSKEKYNIRTILFLCVTIEMLTIFPNQRERILIELRNWYHVSQELSVKNEEGYSLTEEDGEVNERGVLVDLKSGELKFWQKVERKIFFTPD